jgi:DNA-binding CsgD family transcriptional regulator
MRILRRAPDELTERQREVLALLRRGLTNEEIGRELGISTDGAKFHVSQILSKLQLSSRHEAASLPPDAGARRPWWAGALAPLPVLRDLRWDWLAYGAGAAVSIAALLALGVLAWGVFAVRGDDGDPYLVYAHRVGEESQGGRTYPTLEVVTYDVETHERVAAFEVGAAREFPAQVVAAGDRIIVNLEQRIVSYARDGSDARVLADAGDGVFVGVGVSHDASMLAYSQADRFADPDSTEIVVVALNTGDELLRMPQSSDVFEGSAAGRFRGQFAVFIWRDDNRGFVVYGHTHSSAPGDMATVGLDGDVVVHSLGYPLYPWAVAPTGRQHAGGGIEWCEYPRQDEVIIRDLDTHDIVRSIRADGNVHRVEWSPTGGELLFMAYTLLDDGTEECWEVVESTITWHVFDVETGWSIPVDGPSAARTRWYGDAVLTYYCDTNPVDESWCLRNRVEPLEVRVGSTVLEEAVFGFQVIHQPVLANETHAGVALQPWDDLIVPDHASVVRSCTDLPEGFWSHHAAYATSPDGKTRRGMWGYFDAATNESYRLILYSGEDTTACDDFVRRALDDWSPDASGMWPHSNTHRAVELGMTFDYPAGWQFGGAPRPFTGTCDHCFAPARDVEHPYGVSFYYNDNLSEEEYLGCSISCFAGNRAVAPQRLPDREIEVAGLTAEQIDVGRSPPLGLANETGDHTWYDETWTLIRHEGRILFFVSYHRLGDEEGERETAAALDLMLSTFRFD